MSRYFIITFIVMFFTSSSYLNSGKFVQEDDPPPARKTISFPYATAKIAFGAASLVIWNMTDSTDSQERSSITKGCRWLWMNASAGLVTQGIVDCAHLVYNWFYDGVMLGAKGSYRYDKKNKKSSLIKLCNNEDYQTEKENNWHKGTIVLRNTANTIFTSACLFRYGEHLLKLIGEEINPFSLSFPANNKCTSGGFLCAPLTTPVAMIVLCGLLAYQAKEITHNSTRATNRKGDIPLMGILIGLFEVSFGHHIHQKWSDQIISSTRMTNDGRLVVTLSPYLHPIPRAAETLLLIHGSSQMFWNSVQALYNAAHYIKSALKNPHNIEIVQIETGKSIKRKATRLTHVCVQPAIPKTNIGTGKKDNFYSLGEVEETQAPPKPKEKKPKTKGTPFKDGKISIPKSKQSTNSNPTIRQTSDGPGNRDRDNALVRIKDLRGQNPIKTALIDREMRRLCQFLDGNLESAGHNSQKLSWRLGNKPISITYETPHRPSNEYKGNKRDRVLSILEIGYISGLDPEKMEKYIQDYNLYNLLRLDKFCIYTLGQRASLE